MPFASQVGGPDLETEAKGLFGLTFEELLGSERVGRGDDLESSVPHPEGRRVMSP